MRVVVALCLFAPFVAMLWVGSYAKIDPAFIGIPFFYWYQMLWVLDLDRADHGRVQAVAA